MLATKKLKTVLSAVLMSSVVISAAACSSDKNATSTPGVSTGTTPAASQASGPLIELKAITMGAEPASGMANFYKKLDELTKKDFNATVRFTFIPWGDEKNQISRAIVAKEYDLYVGGAWSDFKNFAVKNAFADLTPFLKNTPKLTERYGDILDRLKIDGKNYGIPQLSKPGIAAGEGMLFREDLRKKWGLPEITNLETAEKYLYKAKQEFPDTPMIIDKRAVNNVWAMVAGNKYLTVTSLNGTVLTVASVDEPYKAMSIYDTPEFKQVLGYVKKWYDDGIIAHDVLASQGNEGDKTKELMKAGKKPLEFNNQFYAVSSNYIATIKDAHPEFELNWVDFSMMNPKTIFLPSHSNETTTMISVGAQSKNVETALKFIEKAHVDQTYYNLLSFGVEGENYKMVNGAVSSEGIDAKNKKPAWTGLSDGFMNPEPKYPAEWQGIYEKLKSAGEALVPSLKMNPYEGFVFNTSELAAENSSLETVRTQFALPLVVGMVKKNQEADLEALKQQLKGAGFDKYMAALQKQLDTFAAAKKK
ncbi:sugar ABC transporter substrate-binding protein [Paenibacillus ferrarius]|uniref:Sugar ABC transporter substrate-binding protein n=1 Tax=Paenibacillus ferrarius TaxID=1469647 RepID=A0A1V4H6S4_9BACL|nr:DUF3502 domain-containing protein [Paenibacillus ferrarius]OPH46578.1 sugar ABC transporter substrate-binding protein [Paenibacillus ferrarius]